MARWGNDKLPVSKRKKIGKTEKQWLGRHWAFCCCLFLFFIFIFLFLKED
jgi:hypothetical protein